MSKSGYLKVMALIMGARLCIAADCEPGTTTPVWTIDQVAALASRVFSCTDLKQAIAVAYAESGFRPNCVSTNSDSAHSQDTGLWQMNDLRRNLFFQYGGDPADQRNPQAHACGLNPSCNLSYTYRLWQYGGPGKGQPNAFTQGIWHAFGNTQYNGYYPTASQFVDAHPEYCKSSCPIIGGHQVCPPNPPGSGTTTTVTTGVTSQDPNDKTGSKGIGTARYVGGAQTLTYLVSFDNQPTASAPAQTVTVTDTLNAGLVDLSTLTLGTISFTDKILTPPPLALRVSGTYNTSIDLRPTKNLIVAISVSLDIGTGVLKWTFVSVDPGTGVLTNDATAGFLPPGAEGSVAFSVGPRAASSQVSNKATIVFDLNPPIDTPVWLNTIDKAVPTSHVSALAATQSTSTFMVQWSGTDVGSGIQDFTVYSSDNGSAFTAWQANTAAASAAFTGQTGHTYRFYSLARDLVGNVEPAKSAAETATTVSIPQPSCVQLSVSNVGAGSLASQKSVPVTAQCAWSAISNASWITVLSQGSSGNGNGTVQLSIGGNGGLTRTGTVTVGSQTLSVIQAGTDTKPPFGVVDTPTKGSAGLAGAINFTGWSLSPITISTLSLWREPVNNETGSSNGLIFLGTAPFVPAVRPDVATAYPGYPNNNWGWGAQVLTNYLPGTNGLPLGNGTYKLHAIAADPQGQSTDLSGPVTISVNNAASVLPFGTIDTPGQGDTVSGTNYINFGWVVTPQPNIVPIDGSTITVRIDGVAVGHPTYNQLRSDIATLFPGLRNSNGAVGYFPINTTLLTNGIHNIDWVLTDSAGHSAGIGSRNFFVQN